MHIRMATRKRLLWLCYLLMLMTVSASSATLIVAEAAAAGGGRVMDARSNDRCHVRSKTWKGYKLCLKHGTCNKPCRAEGFDYGSCYPELLHLQFVGDFFHVCFCSMNYCKT